MRMNILDFIDLDNDEHLEAINTWHFTGIWPDGFIPEGTIFQPSWQFVIHSRIAARWLDSQMQRIQEERHAEKVKEVMEVFDGITFHVDTSSGEVSEPGC